MVGCLLDDLPQAVPRSGMGALIAAQGGRGFGGGHEPGLCQYPLRPAGVDEARGIRSRFRYRPARSPDPATVRAGPGHDLQVHEPDRARASRPAQDQLVC